MNNNYGIGYQATASSNVKIGCPVYYSSISDGSSIFHTEICVGYNSTGKPITNSHNGDRYHVPWNRHGAARNTAIVSMLRMGVT